MTFDVEAIVGRRYALVWRFVMRVHTATMLALLLMTSTVKAQRAPGRDPGAADVLFGEGRKATQAGNFAVACLKFQESYRLDPALGTLLNLGDCEEKQGHLVAAWQFFRDAERGLVSDERSVIAKQRWERLEARLAFVTFKLSHPSADARIIRDEVELNAASLNVALPIDPGTHIIRVREPQTIETRVEITLKSGERRDVLLERGAPSIGGAPANVDSSPNASSSKTLPFVAFGVGAVGLITMGIGAWQVLDAKSVTKNQTHCQRGECDQAGLDAAAKGSTFSAVATVGGIVAFVGVAAGVVLLVTSPKKNMALRAGPMAGGFGFSASRVF